MQVDPSVYLQGSLLSDNKRREVLQTPDGTEYERSQKAMENKETDHKELEKED